MRSLRILQIIPSLDLKTGGPTRSVPALGKALSRLGHKVVLYTTTWPEFGCRDKHAVRQEANFGYEINTFPAQRNSLFANLPHSPALVEAVIKRSREFDIVHNFSLWNPVATFSLRALRQSGIPYCLSPLGMLDPVVLYRNRLRKLAWGFLWERANIENALLVHFTTRLEEERAKGLWKLNQTIILPHGINLANWKVLPDRQVMESRFPKIRGREVILFVGRINWVKNLDILLNALAIVLRERPNAMLVCVGPDNEGYQSVLEKQALSLGIEDHTLFTGMLDGDDLKAAYACANVLALVSQKENFGYAAAEALACGIPVVLSTGVGLGSDWPASPAMQRVDPTPDKIAAALIRVLGRCSFNGLPDPEARSLAENFLAVLPGEGISKAFESLFTQHLNSELKNRL
jgi:glycosyltransferase involved in cell wall biosynthesis